MSDFKWDDYEEASPEGEFDWNKFEESDPVETPKESFLDSASKFGKALISGQDIPELEGINQTGDDFARGAFQGGSLGFADEIAGVLQAPIGAAKSIANKFGADFDESEYTAARDDSRLLDAQASERSPGAFTSGQVAGSVASSLIPGLNVAKGAKLGGTALAAGKQGLAMGLGSSTGDNLLGLGDNAAGLALDAAVGGIAGAAGGAAGYGLAKGIEKLAAPVSKGLQSVANYVRPPKQKLNAREIFEASKRMGFKPTPGMLDDSGLIERLESSLAKSPSMLGKGIKETQDSVYQKLSQASQELTDDATTLSPYELGEKFKSDFTASVGGRLDPLAATFDEVAQNTKNIPISPNATSAIKRNIENIDAYRLTGGAGKPQQYVDMIDRLQNANDVKTVMTLLTGDIKAAQGAERQVLMSIKDKLQKLEQNSIMRAATGIGRDEKVQFILNSLDDQIAAGDKSLIAARKKINSLPAKEALRFANSRGLKADDTVGLDLIDELKGARKGYKSLAEDLEKVGEGARLKFKGPAAALDAVEEIPSENIQGKFFKLDNYRQIMNLKEQFPEEFDLLRTGKLKNVLDASMDNTSQGQGRYSVQRFLNQVEKLTPEAKEVLFPDQLGVLKDVTTVQRSLPRNFNPSGTGSEMGFKEVAMQNIKDVPNYALYKMLSSNGGRTLTNNIAEVVKQAPQTFGKFAGVLQNAAQRGTQAVSSTHFILENTNEEYRKLMRELRGEKVE